MIRPSSATPFARVICAGMLMAGTAAQDLVPAGTINDALSTPDHDRRGVDPVLEFLWSPH